MAPKRNTAGAGYPPPLGTPGAGKKAERSVGGVALGEGKHAERSGNDGKAARSGVGQKKETGSDVAKHAKRLDKAAETAARQAAIDEMLQPSSEASEGCSEDSETDGQLVTGLKFMTGILKFKVAAHKKLRRRSLRRACELN